MNALNLHIPAQDLLDIESLEPSPTSLTDWLDKLHSADIEKSAGQVLDVVRKYNRCQIIPAIRYQSLVSLLSIIDEYKIALKGRIRGNPFPLAEKYQKKSELIQNLMQELARGFKIIVADVADDEKNHKVNEKIIIRSIFFAVHYLSETLLAKYLAYTPESDNLWGEINCLYKYAEEKSYHDKEVDLKGISYIKLNTIVKLFKKIILLHIVDPFHLMEGEASKVYFLLDEWVKYCQVIPFDGPESLTGNFYVDLNSGGPPKFAASDMEHNPQLGGVLILNKLLSHLDHLLIHHRQSEATAEASLTLKDRMYRDMLMRLKYIWSGNLERISSRQPDSDGILLATGLTTSHHFISNEEPFAPERDEIRFYKPEGVKKGLSLMPVEEQPWLLDSIEEKLESGVVTPRTSKFDIECADIDAWEKIYSTNARARLLLDSKEPDFTAQIWQQHDTSRGGMGLVRVNPCGIRVWVGDLVAYKFTAHDLQDWFVGTIRWLRDIKPDKLELGVMIITESAQPVAVRAIGGIGKGGEYFRSLLVNKMINKNKNDQSKKTLIVPANIFDVGTEMVFSMKKNISYVRLTQIIETTNTFSQFEYTEIDVPYNEQQNIEAMRGA